MNSVIESFGAAARSFGRAVAVEIIAGRLERGTQPRRQPLADLAETLRRGALDRLGYTLPAAEIAAILRAALREPIITPWLTVRLVNGGKTILARPAYPIARLVLAQEVARLLPDHPGIGAVAEQIAAKAPKRLTRACWVERLARWLAVPLPLPDGRAIAIERHPFKKGLRSRRTITLYPDHSAVRPNPKGFQQQARLPFIPSIGTMIPWEAALWRLIAVEPYTTTKGLPSNVLIWHRIASPRHQPEFRTTGLAFNRLNHIRPPYDAAARIALQRLDAGRSRAAAAGM
ncbi:hypothetical protein [Zavarzinia compransoris]|uniref:Uncharacterized protein n=1 Tax=Zavarzinia compransoris TaxID=1264899 RepID=A0A317E3X6_9PROT|nr:hypothetical protein [Zavarzinia compransoris]PWR21689.1 hypothetical protein DKG75_06735 [Zavarzinia compransoris]TDP45525.1 hypothetical protein DES42_105232 [Zavarzinia compransoris]